VAGIALTLGLLLAILVAFLAVPLTVMFSIRRTEEVRGLIRFRWLFGLVRFQISIPRAGKTATRSRPATQEKEKSVPRRKKTMAGGGRRVLSVIRQPVCRRHVLKFLRSLLRAAHARDLFLRLRIGLGDPADTGRLWAIVGPIAGMARNLRGAVVRIEPEFVDPVFEVESEGQFRLVPIQFILLTVAFLLSPTTWHAWQQLQRGNA
jgi:hypothetical protein